MQILFSLHKGISKSSVENINHFSNSKNSLTQLKTEEIVSLYNSIANYWVSSKCQVLDLFKKEGLGFLIPWLKMGNIEKILSQNFSNISSLDTPFFDKNSESYLYGRPLGIAVHWIAGNVPVLGVISLFQSLLTKNKSIVKVPSAFLELLPKILDDLNNSSYFTGEEKEHLSIILEQTLVVFINRDDFESQKYLSEIADIRIAWGGREAVESIIGLPKKINSRDIIFGPKVSLALATNESLETNEDLKHLVKSIADDIFTFDQAGCNSPHNLIIERGSKYSLEQIAESMSLAFNIKANSNPVNISAIDKYNLLLKRFIYQSNEDMDVIFNTNQWNIFINKSINVFAIEEPLYCRSIFLSEIESIDALGVAIPDNTQSIGLFTSHKRKMEIIQTLSQYHVDRFPNVGKMSLFQHPWDGYLPLQHMVKWISTN